MTTTNQDDDSGPQPIAFDADVIRDMVETEPDAFRAGLGDTEDCPECGLPMLGAKAGDGPFCVRDHAEENEA